MRSEGLGLMYLDAAEQVLLSSGGFSGLHEAENSRPGCFAFLLSPWGQLHLMSDTIKTN